uniref:sodium/glucose cotransporter 4-like isoform X1 n=1 Tax=Myxine glutinosa TaxID=7769 RepID=UPI00358FDF31
MAPHGYLSLSWPDILVLLAYFVFVLVVGVWSSYKANRRTVGGFFLAGRSMTWLPIGASLMSSNVGSSLFIGIAGSGAAGGIAIGGFEWNAAWVLVLLGWVFMPVYLRAEVATMPEFLQKRLGGQRIRIYLSLLSLLLYILTKISADLFSGGLFIQVSLGWNLYLSIIALLLLTAVFTIAGGLTAVMYTDTLHTLVMVAGAFILTFIGFQRVGWYEGFVDGYMSAVPNVTVPNTTCHLPRADAFHMIRDATTADLPWPGLIFGLTVLATWCWCTDQVIVQRCLSAKNIVHTRGGIVLSGYLKILPMFFVVWPGMMSRALFPDEVACVDPEICKAVCGSAVGCSNIAYPKLVLGLLPVGMRGLMVAVMIAALMSSLTSVFNSSSTIVSLDLWRQIRPHASARELLLVGRLFVLILVTVSIAWIPMIQEANSGQLFDYMQSIASYLAPPVTALFILSVFWPKLSESGAFWGLLVGLVVGLVRLAVELSFSTPVCGEQDLRPLLLRNVHYLHFAIFLCFLSACVMIIGSLISPSMHSPSQLCGLTWWNQPHHVLPNSSLNDTPTSHSKDEANITGASWGSSSREPKMTTEERNSSNKVGSNIEKKGTRQKHPDWGLFCHIQALILLTFNIFLWGYFA